MDLNRIGQLENSGNQIKLDFCFKLATFYIQTQKLKITRISPLIISYENFAGVSLDGIDSPDWDLNLNDPVQDSEEELDESQLFDEESYERELRFNNSIREIFLNRFVHIFTSYEHFVIQPNQVSVIN